MQGSGRRCKTLRHSQPADDAVTMTTRQCAGFSGGHCVQFSLLAVHSAYKPMTPVVVVVVVVLKLYLYFNFPANPD